MNTASPEPGHKPALSCRNLQYSYGDEFTLRNINFEVAPGEVVCVLGPNGSGKTTLLGLVSGYMLPIHGEVYAGELNVHRDRINDIVYMPFRPPVVTLRTPYQYWQAFGRIFGHGFRDVARRAAALAPQMVMERCMHKQYAKLSLGMIQKMSLVAAFIPDSKLRVLDEPFSGGIDPLAMEALASWIERAREAGETIIFSSQMTEHAQRLADKVLVLRNGQVAAFGTPDEIIMRAGVTPGEERPFAQAFVAVTEEDSAP